MGVRFWMVLGSGTPTYKHSDWESAKQEAERLARCNPGQEFTVLKAVATVAKRDLDWTVHDEDEDIPF